MIPNPLEGDASLEGDGKNGNPSSFICGVVEGFYGKPWTTVQRKKLFARLDKMKMNTYIYAPKDDCKHRLYWREMYSVEEAEHLSGLINAAETSGVSFVYAISPGIDMTYSSSKEVTLLKRKLEQVASFGCKSFAILFDDIDVDMCEADKEIFQSFAQAQVSVTNEVYQHLGQPEKFFFCPTEYCAARAMPSVESSEYLNTIGSRLLPGIDIMWTGPKVISKRITIKSIEEISKVLKRPPLIWDNIHANDYDPKRMFLGPYVGRSPELIPYLRGVLTNPNCEFEANYIALHTLAQWSRSNAKGVKKDCILSESSSVTEDIKLETDGEYSADEDVSVNADGCSYQPRLALTMAISDWLEEFLTPCDKVKTKMVGMPSIPPISTTVTACTTLTATTTSTIQPQCSTAPLPTVAPPPPATTVLPNLNSVLTPLDVVNDSFMQPTSLVGPVNSLVDPSSSESEGDSGSEGVPEEPMDCIVTPGSSPNLSNCMDASSIPVPITENSQIPLAPVDCMEAEAEPCISVTTEDQDPLNITVGDVSLLVDLFYLPFEHGYQGCSMLCELHWLKVNAHAPTEAKSPTATEEQIAAANDWRNRCERLHSQIASVKHLYNKLCNAPNQAIHSDLHPYLWDITSTLMLVDSYISWLALGQVPYISVCYMQGSSPYTWANKMYRDHFMSGDDEPWRFRGGLQAEFQRLLPFESAPDLLICNLPSSLSMPMLKIRPYQPADKAAVYEVCRRTCDDGADGTEIFPENPDLIGDKLIGGFLAEQHDYCFVVEDEEGICGYVLAALDAREHHNYMEQQYLPTMRNKYPKPEGASDRLTPSEELISSLHNSKPLLPDTMYGAYPSVVRLDMLPARTSQIDPDLPRRALACAVAALKVNGSHGLYTDINVGDASMAESYCKLGFFKVVHSEIPEDVVLLARTI